MTSRPGQTALSSHFKTARRFRAILATAGLGLVVFASIVAAAEMEFAHRLFRDQRYQLAAEEYAAVLASNPPPPVAAEARFYLAEARLQLGQESEALAGYLELAKLAVDENPHARMTRFRVLQLRHRQNALDAVLPLARLFLKEFPSDPLRPYVYCMLGDAAIAAGSFEEARQAFADALKSNPDATLRPTILFGKARLAEREGKSAEASELFEQLARLPDHPAADDARFAVGVLAFQDRRYPEAITNFQKLAEDFPASPLLPSASLNHGLCLLQLEQFDAASSLLAEAASRYPTDGQAAEMLFHAALADFRAGKYRTAKDRLVALLREKPDCPRANQAWYYISRAARECREPSVALAAFDKLVADKNGKEWRDRTAVVAAEALLADPTFEQRAEQLSRLRVTVEEPAARRRLAYYAAVLAMDEKRHADARKDLEEILRENAADDIGPEARYLLGMTLIKQKQWSEAIPHLDAYLLTAPLEGDGQSSASTVATVRALGDALSRAEDTDAHREVLLRVLDRAAGHSDGPILLAALADQQADAGRHARADSIFERLHQSQIEGVPKAKSLVAWGWSLYELQRFDLAWQKFLQAVELGAEDPTLVHEALYMSGVCAQKNKNTASAIDSFEKVLNGAPKSEWSLDAGRRLAELLTAAKRLEDAEKTYAQLAEMFADSPSLARILYDRGWLALERGDKDQAYSFFKQLTDQFPSSEWTAESLLKLAELSFERGDHQASLDHAKALDGTAAEPAIVARMLYRRGLAAKALERNEEAKTAFERLSREFAEDRLASVALFWMAEMAYDAGNPDEALAGFRLLLGRPDAEKYHATARLRVAQTLVLLKKSAEARRAAEEILADSAEPSVAREARFALGRALVMQAKFDEARAAFESVIGDDRSEIAAKARFMIAETYFHQRRFEEALKDFLKVELLYPIPEWQSLALLEAGKCHEQMGQSGEAIVDYRKLLERFGESSSAPVAKERLSALENTRKE